MIKIRKKLLKSFLTLVFVLFVSLGLIGGCGTTPPEAPFGSELTFVPEIEGITFCGVGLETELFRVVLTGPDGFPLSDVAVSFDVSFAGDQSFIIDTDGDGIGDSALLQLVDNDACPGDCTNTPIEDFVSFGALVDNIFVDITDDSGVAEVLIITPGFFNIFDDTGQVLAADPATITAFSGSTVVTSEFDYNTDCDLPEMMDEGA